MKNTLETRLGVFFALAIIVAFIILEMIGATDVFKKGYRVHATFQNVQELKQGDRVKTAGVEVGYVEEIVLRNGKARVTLKIREPFKIKANSRASVKFTGLMGQNFIAIEGGAADSPDAMPGIELETYEQPDISVIMTKLDNVAGGIEGLTKSFSPENFSSLLGPITDFVKQNSGNLRDIVTNIRTVTGNISEGKGTIGKLINQEEVYNSAFNTLTNLQTVSADLRGVMGKADELITQARDTVADARAGKGTLGRLITDDSLFNEGTNAITNLRQILEKINQGKGSVGELVNDNTFIQNAKLGLQKIEKATEGIEDQGPLSIVGLIISPLF